MWMRWIQSNSWSCFHCHHQTSSWVIDIAFQTEALILYEGVLNNEAASFVSRSFMILSSCPKCWSYMGCSINHQWKPFLSLIRHCLLILLASTRLMKANIFCEISVGDIGVTSLHNCLMPIPWVMQLIYS